MADLQQYNIVGQFQQGYDRGQAQRANKLAGLAISSQGADRQAALGQLGSIDPRTAMGLTSAFQQQDAAAQAQQVDHQKKINGAARFMVQALETKDPVRIQGAYQAVRPYLAELGASQGKVPPDQFDPAMAPMVYQLAGASGGLPDPKTYNVSPGGKVVDASGQVIADNPTQPHDTGELATLRAMQQDPSLLDTYRKAHPVASGSGMGRAPMGYRFNPDGSLSAIPGGPADHSQGVNQGLSDDALTNSAWRYVLTGDPGIKGYGKEATAQRAQVYNMVAKIAKDAGVSPQELATTSGRNKALQSSLSNLQKQSDVMQKSEMGFQNNMDQALALSDKLDRTGSPVLNKWLLGGKAALGDPDVAAFDAAINAASVDYARIMSGQSGAGGTPISTAEEAKSLLRKELSNKSLHAVADVLYKDIQGQQQATHSQLQTIQGAMRQFGNPGQQAAANPRATNPQTGETVELVNGQWVPVHG